MLLETIIDETFHDNGKLSYRATMAKIAKSKEHLYKHRRLHPTEGYCWVYIGIAKKWDKNGNLQWMKEYNEKGEVIHRKNKAFE